MSLTLLYGSSVSRRTEQLYETLIQASIAQPERSFIMLVPEQASLSVQQELVRLHPRHALTNVDVLTFNRLAYRVFQDLSEPGKGLLDDTGKLMLLELVMGNQKEELKALRRNLGKPGFTDEVKSVISELAQYNISAGRLKDHLQELSDHPALYGKMSDISLIYTEFMRVLHEDYEMAEERTARLSERIPDWEKAKETSFFLEGFTGFTPPQYAVLQELLKNCPELVVGVQLGSGEKLEDHRDEDALFYMSAHMAGLLKELAIRSSVPYTETAAEEDLKQEFSSEIHHIEQALFRYPIQGYPEKTEKVRIVRAADRKEEIAALRKEILESVREGLRFSEMAVITGNVETYREEIEFSFNDADIPFFIDAGRPLSGNPLILLVTEALRVAEEDFSFDAVFAFAKNPLVLAFLGKKLEKADDLTPFERAAELENYALALGMRGSSTYGKEWIRKYKGFSELRLAAVNETREVLSAPLLVLRKELKKKETDVREMLTALTRFLMELGAEETMQELSQAFLEEGENALSREYASAYSALVGLFENMEAILGDARLSFDEFTAAFNAGLSRLSVGLVPPTLDRLVIGDLKRTRLGRIRRLFIVGANDGLLPPVKADGGLLMDTDRELLLSKDLPLSPTAREDSFTMQFYLYMLLTKPRECLYLSYAAGDENGKLLALSPIIEDLKALFPKLLIERARPGILFEKDGLKPLAHALRRMEEGGEDADEETAALYRLLKEKADDEDGLLPPEKGFLYRYRPEALSEESARRLFRETLTGSVSRLERYASCAYQHFLSYGLRLLPRKKYLLEAADYGNLLHDSINLFFEKLEEKGLSFREIDEATHSLVEESVREVTEREGNAILKDSARNEYLVQRVDRIAARTLWALRRQWEAGGYSNTESELPFGPADRIPALTLPLGEGLKLSLQGRIDRLDYVKKDGITYVKVIDYKSSGKKIEPTRVYYGLQLQLLIYLKAAGELMKKRDPGSEIIPAGIYYYHMDDPLVEPPKDGQVEKAILKELKLEGYTSSDGESGELLDKEARNNSNGYSSVAIGLRVSKEGITQGSRVVDGNTLRAFSDFALQKAQELSSSLIRGDIRIDPYEEGGYGSCTYCDFKSVCGFDRKVGGFRMRRLEKKTAEDIKGAVNGSRMDS